MTIMMLISWQSVKSRWKIQCLQMVFALFDCSFFGYKKYNEAATTARIQMKGKYCRSFLEIEIWCFCLTFAFSVLFQFRKYFRSLMVFSFLGWIWCERHRCKQRKEERTLLIHSKTFIFNMRNYVQLDIRPWKSLHVMKRLWEWQHRFSGIFAYPTATLQAHPIYGVSLRHRDGDKRYTISAFILLGVCVASTFAKSAMLYDIFRFLFGKYTCTTNDTAKI